MTIDYQYRGINLLVSGDIDDLVDELLALRQERDDLRAKLTEMTDERDAAREDIVALRDAVHDHHVRLTQVEKHALRVHETCICGAALDRG